MNKDKILSLQILFVTIFLLIFFSYVGFNETRNDKTETIIAELQEVTGLSDSTTTDLATTQVTLEMRVSTLEGHGHNISTYHCHSVPAGTNSWGFQTTTEVCAW